MATLQCKHLFVVTFILLFFFSIKARGNKYFFLLSFKTIIFWNVLGFNIFFLLFAARVLKEDSTNGVKKGFEHANQFTANQEAKVVDDDQTDELVSMDYTPANKNPPIHN